MVDYNKVKEILEQSEDWDYIKKEVAKDPLAIVDETSSSGQDRLNVGVLVLDNPLDRLYSKVLTSCQEQWSAPQITEALVVYYLYGSCVFYLILKDFIKVIKDIKITDRNYKARYYKLYPVAYDARNRFIGILSEDNELTFTIKYCYYNDSMYFDFKFIPGTAEVAELIPFKVSDLIDSKKKAIIYVDLRTGDSGYSGFTDVPISIPPDKFTKTSLELKISAKAYYSFEEWYS